jgi:hypothetical protein
VGNVLGGSVSQNEKAGENVDGKEKDAGPAQAPQQAQPTTGPNGRPILTNDPEDLKNAGYVEVTHPEAAKVGVRTFTNPTTGDTIEFHGGTPGAFGNRGLDHYHQANPASTNDRDKYLDNCGNGCGKNSAPSHLYPGD